MSAQDVKVWLITGSSTGFGRTLAETVLKEGDRVIATARKPEQLAGLVEQFSESVKVIALDVTQPEQIQTALEQALATFGQIDVLVNNAGYGLIGALEEVSQEQIRRNFETNLFGAINMMRAILPIMRQQGRGHIVNMSAIAGFTNELGFSIYGKAKFALEGMSEALRGEVAPFGIKVTIVEPGPFRTDFIGRSLVRTAHPMPEYETTVGKFLNFLNTIEGKQPGDPEKAANAIIQVVKSENPPLRLVLGKYAYAKFREKIESLTQELDAWAEVGMNTDFETTQV
ncbi:oxidoreductase [Gloeocapsopsis dulcis]|uniref:Short-chain dehydrogenase/reductase n=1 Tax=Gloeocapsopsis dulcis AAB1 = 1H9 TaxID=1433147 RepID=A0A6N8G073_9CHRO|nr:oxidoreductase [Gloeocapsopsis dulcis]MUL37556.1 short-chain dehydrogenase/reductase [Gloeocapsopsis dulcis AAB1 = 1H9]WNN87969.1 oxidoreductase [Gloeocapsopsis dulcis]